MDPHQQFCHNQHCRAYGRPGEGHIVIHSQKEQRYRCKRCGRTFSATKGTALYRMHKPKELVLTVVTLLAYGCPLQAIVAAFSVDDFGGKLHSTERRLRGGRRDGWGRGGTEHLPTARGKGVER